MCVCVLETVSSTSNNAPYCHYYPLLTVYVHLCVHESIRPRQHFTVFSSCIFSCGEMLFGIGHENGHFIICSSPPNFVSVPTNRPLQDLLEAI